MSDPIPNLFDKYGGAEAMKPIVLSYTRHLVAHPTLRKYFGGLSNEQIIGFNFALFALVLGKPLEGHDFSTVRNTLTAHHLTWFAYEEIVRLVRQALLEASFVSRDASIAINVMDMHCEAVLGIPPRRRVTSPFSGVDRRRRPRIPTGTTSDRGESA